MNNFEKIYHILIERILEFTPRIISAFLIFIIGWYTIKFLKRLAQKYLEKKETDPTLVKFLLELVVALLKIILFISVVSKLGVETSTFVAILGAAGLAIGLALQGSLSNFAGGVLIIFLKPFKVGDFIEAQGQMGSVKEILIFNTILLTPDNQTIYIPNGILSNGTIINYTKAGIRRADLTIGISYDSNMNLAKKIALEVMKNHQLVLQEPEPIVWIKDMADSSINLTIRPWANISDFWQVRSDVLQQIKESFDENNIKIPFPQRDVYIHQR